MIDVFIGLLLAYEIYRGLKNGFVSEAGSILGLIIAFYTATAMRGSMAKLLSPVCFDSPTWSSAIGFLITFLVVYLLIVILAKIFEGFLGIIALGGVNRVAGGFFCLFKGALIFSILLNLYETIDSDRSLIGPKNVESSIFYKPILKVAPTLFPHFGSSRPSQVPEKPDSQESTKTIE